MKLSWKVVESVYISHLPGHASGQELQSWNMVFPLDCYAGRDYSKTDCSLCCGLCYRLGQRYRKPAFQRRLLCRSLDKLRIDHLNLWSSVGCRTHEATYTDISTRKYCLGNFIFSLLRKIAVHIQVSTKRTIGDLQIMVRSQKGEVKKHDLQAFHHSEPGRWEMYWRLVAYFLQFSDGWELIINQIRIITICQPDAGPAKSRKPVLRRYPICIRVCMYIQLNIKFIQRIRHN